MEIVNPRHRAAVRPKARQAHTFARCAPAPDITPVERWSAGRNRTPRRRPPAGGYDVPLNDRPHAA